jgi:L-ribulokinase
VLNQVYADVLGKLVLVPAGVPTSQGSAIFALLAAGAFPTIEAAQAKLCLKYTVFLPRPEATAIYKKIYALYRKAYFALGTRSAEAVALGDILPDLRRITRDAAENAQ